MRFKKLRTTLIIILSVIFAVSAFHIIKITHDYKTADKTNIEIREQFVQMIEPTTESTAENEKIQMPICIDFDALKQENNDIIGWIYCPDTPINYPVVKGNDNNQYLRADLKGKYLVSGTIFADYRNNEVGEDKNYIVYGHNMKNSTMFGTLVKYKDQTYYDTHPMEQVLAKHPLLADQGIGLCHEYNNRNAQKTLAAVPAHNLQPATTPPTS